MYLVYIDNLNDNIRLLDFSETSEDAYELLEEHAKEFINEYEGKKKWDSVFIDEKTECNKLKDGYYFIKKNNMIEVFNKTSEIINNIGWIVNSQETHHKMNLISKYNIAEFQRHLLNKFIVDTENSTVLNLTKKCTKSNIPDKIKPTYQVRNHLDNIIDEIKRVGFRPIPRKLNSIYESNS